MYLLRLRAAASCWAVLLLQQQRAASSSALLVSQLPFSAPGFGTGSEGSGTEPAEQWRIEEDISLLERQGCALPKSACLAIIRETGSGSGSSTSAADARRVQRHAAATGGRNGDAAMAKALVEAFGRCGAVSDAEAAFAAARRRNPELWACLLTVYLRCNHHEQGIALFRIMLRDGTQMRREAFAHALQCAAALRKLDVGRLIHSCMLSSPDWFRPVVVASAIAMYSACSSIPEARAAFDAAPKRFRDASVWGAMIAAYAEHGYAAMAMELFWEMNPAALQFEEGTLRVALTSATGPRDVARVAHRIAACGHACGLRLELLQALLRLGCLREALEVFTDMAELQLWGLEEWEAMAAALEAQGLAKQVLRLRRLMELEGLKSSTSGLSSAHNVTLSTPEC